MLGVTALRLLSNDCLALAAKAVRIQITNQHLAWLFGQQKKNEDCRRRVVF